MARKSQWNCRPKLLQQKIIFKANETCNHLVLIYLCEIERMMDADKDISEVLETLFFELLRIVKHVFHVDYVNGFVTIQFFQSLFIFVPCL